MYLQKLNKYNYKLTSFIGGTALPAAGGGGEEKIIKGMPIDGNKYPELAGQISDSLNLEGWNFINLDGFTIYEKKSENQDESRPNLFVMSGFSLNSVRESGIVIVDKIDLLLSKFRAVYIINLTPFKTPQNTACEIRNAYSTTNVELLAIQGKDGKESAEYRAKVRELGLEHRKSKNAAEIQMYENAGVTVNQLITKLGLQNVHILGECAGGGVAIALVKQDLSRYKALYLSVPARPDNVSSLPPEVLQKVKFRFQWNRGDPTENDWHKEERVGETSTNEKEVYDQMMSNFSGIDYKSYLYDQDPGTTPRNNRVPAHEIHRSFIDQICSEL
jgi:hypothetical protein